MTATFFKPGIHPTASIEDGAKIGENVSVGAYSFIGPQVILQDGAKIGQNVVLAGNTTIGENSKVFPFSVIGSPAQDLKYPNFEEGVVRIGKNNTIREKCSIHAGTPEDETVIGDHNYIMSETHIGHDCKIGNHIVLASVGLSGHIEIEDNVVLGAKSGFHQFLRIGRLSMVAGVSAITKDVPPFALSENERPNEFGGLNVIGLKRNGFTKSQIQEIRGIYKFLYDRKGPVANRIQPLADEFAGNPFAEEIIAFLHKSKRNLCMPPLRS
ncbi:MAG: acyl-ACP--UDP-N-acetylglucosamine O-acyltransferase [Spirochaetota bacterium]